MSNRCPKCDTKLSPFYLKQNCPKCGVNLLYYKLDERLENDAREAQRQVDSFNRFKNTVKLSSVSSPFTIIRLVLFFLPLAPMCLPMYSDISLISVIMGIIGGSFDIGANILPLAGMVLLIVLSLAVIISSLFSATKNGLVRNLILSGINLLVFAVLGVIIGNMGIGWYICLLLLICQIALHFVCDKKIKAKAKNQ